MRRHGATTRRSASLGAAAFLMAPGLAAAQSGSAGAHLAIVHPLTPADRLTSADSPRYRALFDQLRHLGFVEGRNLQVGRWSGEGRADRFAALAQEVVQAKPDVIFTTTTPLGKAFQAATRTVPIVAVTADPVAMGLAANLARPGGNITGVSIDPGLEIMGKRVQLLRELVPSARRFGYLSRAGSLDQPDGAYLRDLCVREGLPLIDAAVAPPFDEPAYRRAFAALEGQQIHALCIAAQAENAVYQRLIAELALQARIATVFDSADNVDAGGLLSYGVDLADVYRQAAGLIARILSGTAPQRLPFLLPTSFELSINRATARQLGIAVPTSLLARADHVVE